MESLRENASIETQIENDAIKNKYNEKWKIDLKLQKKRFRFRKSLMFDLIFKVYSLSDASTARPFPGRRTVVVASESPPRSSTARPFPGRRTVVVASESPPRSGAAYASFFAF